jgi:hypothetical protein
MNEPNPMLCLHFKSAGTWFMMVVTPSVEARGLTGLYYCQKIHSQL